MNNSLITDFNIYIDIIDFLLHHTSFEVLEATPLNKTGEKLELHVNKILIQGIEYKPITDYKCTLCCMAQLAGVSST